jgi:undecaprenyl-diphosphatase
MQRRLFGLLLFFQLLFFTAFAQSPLQKLDDRIMIDLADHRTPEQTGVFMFLSNTYRYGDYGIPAGLMVAGIIRNDKSMRENSVYIASSTAISYGVTLLLKHLVKRPRPFIQNINIVPVYRAGSTSFPSGHTSTTFSTATALSIAYPKWYVIAPAFLWAGSVSYSRMYLGVHYPTDVAAGAFIGAGSAVSLSFMKK